MRKLSPIPKDMLGLRAARIAALSGAPWTSGADFKEAFRREALKSQEHLCAYCMFHIGDAYRVNPDIEHFADKAKYAQWTFEILNLFLTCQYCNQTLKRSYDTIMVASETYAQCSFALVHPYLDDVVQHIRGGWANLDDRPQVPQPMTLKGARTIRLFKLQTDYVYASWVRAFEDRQARRSMSAPELQLYAAAKDELDGY